MATIVFVGRDANYSKEISGDPFFRRILEYHDDGVAFWQHHRVHHPFLHDDYPFDKRRDGVRYHANFAKLGLGPKFAPRVSFVELLDVPTIGVTGKDREGVFDSLVNPNHLMRLDSLLSSGGRRMIFLSSSVLQKMQALGARYGLFRALASPTRLESSAVAPLTKLGETEVYLVYHFSSTEIYAQLPDLANTIRRKVGEHQDAEAPV